jgi:DNA-binding CsgD family transcriptional regulator
MIRLSPSARQSPKCQSCRAASGVFPSLETELKRRSRELVASLAAEIAQRFDAIDQRLERIDAELEEMSGAPRTLRRLAELERTLERLLSGELDMRVLTNHLALTAAEARVGVALFQGESIKGYARSAGMKIDTARWYVKQIYPKTGVHRQTELIHLLLQCHAPEARRSQRAKP